LTQKELAEKAGVSRYTVIRIENGDKPTPLITSKLAKAFDMPVEEFQKWVT